LLLNSSVRDRAGLVAPIITSSTIAQMSDLANGVYIDPAIVAYVTHIAQASRRHPHVKLGASMRGCLALVRTAKVRAVADGRAQVVPDDIKSLVQPVLCHRLILDAEAQFNGVSVEGIIAGILQDIASPAERVA
jgi:MoxR-like ATPase